MEFGSSCSHHATAGSRHSIGAPDLEIANGVEQLRTRGVEHAKTRFALRIPQMDHHSVRKVGDGHVSDGEQDLVQVERLPQESRRIGEHRHPLLGALLLGDVARDFGEPA